MPPIDPAQLKGMIFSIAELSGTPPEGEAAAQPVAITGRQASFADLFDTADKYQVTIDSAAVRPLAEVVLHCAHAAETTVEYVCVSEPALEDWERLVQQSNGQMLAAADIWGWIKDWFPDPVEAGIVQPPGLIALDPTQPSSILASEEVTWKPR